MHRGYIKVWRKLVDSDIYRNLNSKHRDLMVQCLLMANHEPQEWEWQGELITCLPGQFKTSLESIKFRCANDVSLQNIRTGLDKLEKWGFLTNKSTKSGRIITICKWDKYQPKEVKTNKVSNRQVTDNQQTGNRQLTSNKNEKNEKNENISLYPFEVFWNDYDKKVGDQKKIKAKFEAIPEAARLLIKAHIVKYKASQPDKQYRKNPETYLNQSSWTDEIITRGESQQTAPASDAHVMKRKIGSPVNSTNPDLR